MARPHLITRKDFCEMIGVVSSQLTRAADADKIDIVIKNKNPFIDLNSAKTKDYLIEVRFNKVRKSTGGNSAVEKIMNRRHEEAKSKAELKLKKMVLDAQEKSIEKAAAKKKIVKESFKIGENSEALGDKESADIERIKSTTKLNLMKFAQQAGIVILRDDVRIAFNTLGSVLTNYFIPLSDRLVDKLGAVFGNNDPEAINRAKIIIDKEVEKGLKEFKRQSIKDVESRLKGLTEQENDS